VEYIKKIEPETIFYITTNGTIMNDEIARFFATNNFIVTFSLDGYKENHDRNRIFIDRRKSFDTVIKNIKKLKAVKNELGDNNPISFNCCFDLYTDLEKVVYFFEENYHEFAPFFITYAPIKKVDTTYYEWCDKRYLNDTEFKKGTLYESKRKLENKLFYKNEFSTEFKEVAASLFLGELTFYIRNKNHNIGILRNSCLPLSKMTVTPDGKIVLCEKMCEKFPVGHVNEGIDWNKLCDITNALIRFFNSDKCRKCKVRAMCEACFMYLDSNGMISEDFCNEKITNFEKELEHHYKLYEDRVNILDVLKDNRDNILKVQEVSK
ncbi:MAG: hypothetical protein IJH34_10305, partial [Romboutsia sp.]|nr:hypothetical protein [Romboutsia sp.]